MHRYQIVTRTIRDWIEQGTLKPSERVPSVREMSSLAGFSQITIRHAYALLESEGIITARPRSGYYVAKPGRMLAELPDPLNELSRDARHSKNDERPQLRKLLGSWTDMEVEGFANIYPSRDLMPNRELYSCLVRVLRQEAYRGFTPGDSTFVLRDLITKRATKRGVLTNIENITLVSSPGMAFDLCLDMLVEPGDTVMIESPTDIRLLSSLRRRKLQMVEIYSNPRSGIDPEQFGYLLDNNPIKVCLLTPVNHSPTGTLCSGETMLRIVSKATDKGVRIIENDLFGELSFGPEPARSLKAFDPGQAVLQVGSFAATLGYRFETSWILHHQTNDMLRQNDLHQAFAGGETTIAAAIADYLRSNSYERHLRRLRDRLETRVLQGLALMSKGFPQNCSASRPRGGFTCWVRGSSRFDAIGAAMSAARRGIRLAPGPLYSAVHAHNNFIAMNLSSPWDEQWKEKLDFVGSLLAA